jgi:mono/diheme cytochrome c family protein
LSLAVCALGVAACGNMREQPKLAEPFAPSPSFGVAAREILTQTVPVGFLQEDELRYGGTIGGQPADLFPQPVTRDLIERGQEQYNTFCSPCHGFVGNGDGVVVQRGYPAPPSLHDSEIVAKPAGHYFQVITNGQNTMYSYAGRVEPDDRWAIVAYIRALQLSQNAPVNTLPADDQDQIQAAAPAKEANSGNATQ